MLTFSFDSLGRLFRSAKNETGGGNFIGTSLDGRTFALAGMRGKVVLVAFWSTAFEEQVIVAGTRNEKHLPEKIYSPQFPIDAKASELDN